MPLGATTKMDGCAAIDPAISAIFIAQFFQVPKEHSWVLAAKEKGLTIYSPGFEDSTLGNIFCAEVHRSRSNLWSGRWQIACVSPDGDERRLLVIHRNIEPREFLTANGLISFLVDIGFGTVAFPVQVGASVNLGPEHRVSKDDPAVSDKGED